MPDLDIIGRLVAACVVGAAIGLNRDLANKPIGARTLSLVCLGAATICAAALRHDGIAGNPDATARILHGSIEGIMTGVGFIGAGVILRDLNKQAVHGLTTAATVWITAALGIVCGIADWAVVLTTTALTLGILTVLLWIEDRIGNRGPD